MHRNAAARLQAVKQTTDGEALQCEGHQRAQTRALGLMHCNAAALLQVVKQTTDGEALQCEGRRKAWKQALGLTHCDCAGAGGKADNRW
jgi:hypothetical protein